MEPVRRLGSKVKKTSREYKLKALVTLTATAKLVPLDAAVTVGFTDRLASPGGAAETPAAQLIMLRSSIAAPGWCWKNRCQSGSFPVIAILPHPREAARVIRVPLSWLI